ncbi:hypothetical protein BT63DRAFT_242582 [Microthyrium microscopicum]|uniref:Uncharacterized protein n=1 Tax=Microthyrium microscopicum TaxID=703497 RepID=A0A6A6UIA9_9PEZI|nr:hypothetical protein BT63DRAFT_242582 [Microthyrium microscopicum]
MVLDNRVTCQIPMLYLAPSRYGGLFTSTVVSGFIGATRLTPRLNNTAIPDEHDNEASPFTCYVPFLGSVTKDHRIALCQLPEFDNTGPGGLISEFPSLTNLTDYITGVNGSQHLGTAYIVLNVELGDDQLPEGDNLGSVSSYERGIWQDLEYKDVNLTLSISLCYAAFTTANLPVRMSSPKNRTEPSPKYNSTNQTYRFDDIRALYGQERDKSNMARGLLDLTPIRASWLAQSDELPINDPWIRGLANLGSYHHYALDMEGNIPASLWQSWCLEVNSPNIICPDPMHLRLFQEILNTGGSLAFALQSLISSLASINYYDKLALLDESEKVQQAYFMTSNAPVRHAGFIAVAAVMVFHMLMVIICLATFLAGTKWSILGNTWCSVAQLVASATIDFWDKAANGMPDRSVRELLKADGRNRARVGVSEDDYGAVGLVEK